MFNSARIPAPHRDLLSPPDFTSPDSLKVLLMIHNWCYSISVYHPPTSANSLPQLIQPREIEYQICAVVSDVEHRLANGETAVPIGALSADQRDQWAEARLSFFSSRFLLMLTCVCRTE